LRSKIIISPFFLHKNKQVLKEATKETFGYKKLICPRDICTIIVYKKEKEMDGKEELKDWLGCPW
jgi:hypothetical protein